MIQQRKKRNSSKVNLIISVIFHGVLITVAFFFAAREGMLGKKMKQITATLVAKEKKPEPPKPKPEQPKQEPRKVEERKIAVAQPKVAPVTPVAPPPSVDTGPAVAPAAAVLSGFEFGGGKEVVSMASDPNSVYKAKVERTLREAWKRPSDIQDDNFMARVELSIEPTGRLTGYQWVSGSGNPRWDASVRDVLDHTTAMATPPPTGFPHSFEVRFDVETEVVEGLRLGKL
ncbi:MAG TPA: TonB C-terminal domain-containing protein [Verrucomicrobiae bacterium]|jgi:outer membrane biosynthesis protein TonB|nr:TonB C-terminal domain-containing protein [Verrucomicrobiae bacterium]